jgi:hypothetical protein
MERHHKNQGGRKLTRLELEEAIPPPFTEDYQGPLPLPVKEQSCFELRRYHAVEHSNHCEIGVNPRARGTNPRAKGTNPRALRPKKRDRVLSEDEAERIKYGITD